MLVSRVNAFFRSKQKNKLKAFFRVKAEGTRELEAMDELKSSWRIAGEFLWEWWKA